MEKIRLFLQRCVSMGNWRAVHAIGFSEHAPCLFKITRTTRATVFSHTSTFFFPTCVHTDARKSHEVIQMSSKFIFLALMISFRKYNLNGQHTLVVPLRILGHTWTIFRLSERELGCLSANSYGRFSGSRPKWCRSASNLADCKSDHGWPKLIGHVRGVPKITELSPEKGV